MILYYFRARLEPARMLLGFGSCAFEARDDAARAYNIDPAELVQLARDSRWCP